MADSTMMNYDDLLTNTTRAARNAGFEPGTKEYAEIVSALIKATAIENAAYKLGVAIRLK